MKAAPSAAARAVDGTAVRAVAALVAAMALAGAARAAGELPGFAAVRAAWRPSDITLYDRHGEPLQTVRVDRRSRRLAWVPLQDVSPALARAVVLGEDQHFYEHGGIDWGAVAGSAWGNLRQDRARGASTLTMQLAGLLGDDLARPAGGRSVAQKLRQALAAREIEATWRKDEILEAYLNRVAWRGEIVGIGALSQTLFGKYPSGLDAQESALAAALLRAPNARPEAVAKRACALLEKQALACEGVAALAEGALARRGAMPLGEQLAPHYARQVVGAATREDLRTPLDAGLQRLAIAALREQLGELAGRNVGDGAVVVLDNASGEVLAWVGSSGIASDAPEVDNLLARRQPGSTLKPFVYQLALEKGLITPATLLDDAPAQIPTASGLYLPRDYDRRYRGWVSARTALASSLNVPAVRVATLLGPDALHARLNAFGLALPESGGYYGASLALGSADVTLLALANAYRSLANGGLYAPVALLPNAHPNAHPNAQPTARRVAGAASSWLVGDMLADNEARAASFGLDSVLATRGRAAVKTGTSKDMRDNWCVGYTDRYTVGVWVGNASGAPMHEVSGVSGAAPVWQALAGYLQEGRPSRAPAPPAGVVRAPVRFEGGTEAPRDEWFVAGTEPGAIAGPLRAALQQPFGIASPRDGSLFALDPDMPPEAQRIVFEGEPGVWILDGHRLGRGSRLRWAPRPGLHRLTLQARDGRVLQTLRFEVRGAALKAAANP